ncbi:serine-rich adhesin for platelets-like protein [Tanacetum coccineum]
MTVAIDLLCSSAVMVNRDASPGSNNVIKEIASNNVIKEIASNNVIKEIASNNVIKEIASKLAESRKSKVKALVNAFETMISASKLAESRKSKVKAL